MVSSTMLASTSSQGLERVLAAMAGPEARPREDQTAAVAALVEQRPGCSSCRPPAGASRRSTGRPRRRCGPPAAGPTLVVSPLLALMRDQVAAAARAGLRRGHGQLHQPRRVGRGVRRHRRRPARRAAGLARAAGQPAASPPRCPACSPAPGWSSSTRRTASPTGASTSAPTTSAWPGRCSRSAPTRRCWPPPPRPTSASPPTSPRQLGADTLTFRGSLARSSLRLAVVPGLDPLERYAWVADALRSLRRFGHRLRADRRRDRAAGRLPRIVRDSRSRPTPADSRPTTAQRIEERCGATS